MLDLPTGTVTFLFTDIEGSTLLLQRLGADYAGLLADHHRLLRAAIQKWRGVEVDTQGDAFFVAFSRAADAVRAVQEMQYSLAAHTWPAQASVRVRMALHTGEPALTLMGYVGLDVHRAARICSAGYGGQVLLSAATQAIAAADLPEGASLRLLGAYRLKDLQRPEEIYQLVISGLPADFPPLKSLDLHPNNLPLQLTSFIGRAGEIALVEAALERSRLVTLTGPGGAGKTRLALQVGAELLDRYPDGIWFVELAPLSSPALVPQAVAAALKLPENPNLPLMETLCAALSPRSSLIILDNCEHLVEAAARLAGDLLRICPHLKILATSREILNLPGEAVMAVPSLSLPAAGVSLSPEAFTQYESVRLFIDRAIAWQPGFRVTEQNAAAIARICTALDGIPLALELAAARVRSLAVEQIAARLDDRFRLLTRGSRTGLPHHQTLTAAIDWSYDLLSEPERLLFRRLAVFAGSWSLEAAEQVCAGAPLSQDDILDLLARLVDKSLVLCDQSDGCARYHCLETLRQYALDKLAEAGEADRIRGAHFQAFYKLVLKFETIIRTQAKAALLNSLEQDHDNLRTALAWGFAQAQPCPQEGASDGFPADRDLADQVIDMVAALTWFWFTRSHTREAAAWSEQAKGLSKIASLHAKGRAALALGFSRWQVNNLAEAQANFEQSYAHFLAASDLFGEADSLHMLGHVRADQGFHAESRQLFERSMAIFRQIGHNYMLLTLLGDLGLVAYLASETDLAFRLCNEQLELAHQIGDPDNTAAALNRLGDLCRLTGSWERAGDYYRACQTAVADTGFTTMNPSLMHNLAHVALNLGNLPEALGLFRQGMDGFMAENDHKGALECLEGLAETCVAQADYAKAALLFGAADAARRAAQMQWWPANRLDYDRGLASLSAALAPPAREEAWQAGMRLPFEQAVELAQEGCGGQPSSSLDTASPD